jgi:16S rRNA (guanine527-N7)-methyltransferase
VPGGNVSREIIGLSRLTGRYGLSERQLDQFTRILERLAADELAPTTVRDPGQAVDVHLADSLAALELEIVSAARKLVDIGTGAGFPGLALAVALPASEVVLVESQARKCAFVERVLDAAEVENARVICTRAEEWREGLGSGDVVMARALAAQPVVLEYAAPLLRLRGTLIDWRGAREEEDEARASLAAEELGLHLTEIRHVEPYEGARDHHLHVYEKVHETPACYPRRTGVARKRPFGGVSRSGSGC